MTTGSVKPAAPAAVAILGAGQLGTRHMQSLAKDSDEFRIYMVDPAPHMRVLVEARLKEIDVDPASVACCASADELPARIDFAIVATNSRPRLSALRALLDGREVGAVVLEKFLFPCVSDYAQAAGELAAAAMPAFVNCPRRLYDGYVAIRSEIGGPVSLEMEGGDWGLASNAIHWLDLLDFLSPVESLEVRTALSAPIAAKRAGYFEFKGVVEASDRRGNRLRLVSHDEARAAVVRIHDAAGSTWEIREDERRATHDGRSYQFPVPYQSELTIGVAREWLATQRCNLVTYVRSAELHLALLDQFLQSTNARPDDECLIT